MNEWMNMAAFACDPMICCSDILVFSPHCVKSPSPYHQSSSLFESSPQERCIPLEIASLLWREWSLYQLDNFHRFDILLGLCTCFRCLQMRKKEGKEKKIVVGNLKDRDRSTLSNTLLNFWALAQKGQEFRLEIRTEKRNELKKVI